MTEKVRMNHRPADEGAAERGAMGTSPMEGRPGDSCRGLPIVTAGARIIARQRGPVSMQASCGTIGVRPRRVGRPPPSPR